MREIPVPARTPGCSVTPFPFVRGLPIKRGQPPKRTCLDSQVAVCSVTAGFFG